MKTFDDELQQLINTPEQFITETEQVNFRNYIDNYSDNSNSLRESFRKSFPYFPIRYEFIEKQIAKLNSVDDYLDFLGLIPLPISYEILHLAKYDTFELLENSLKKEEDINSFIK